MTEIKYTPSETDEFHLQEIRDFLNGEGIPFLESDGTYGLFYLNGGSIELRYVDSYYFPIDNSKRFGDSCKGVDKDYFIKISHENLSKGVRTIWVFDFEMEQRNKKPTLVHSIDTHEFVSTEDYRRQWEVIKNTIRTACGKIKYRFYARDCECREIPREDVRPFLEANCFYGFRSATINLGLYLKKDKNGLKAGTLLFLYSFGYNFYGNKKKEKPKIEVIRASTLIGCQVIGGISKCIKHFCMEYPTINVGGKEVDVDEMVYYVDASHNDGRGMVNANSSFEFVSWEGGGFMNRWTCDYQDEEYPNLHGKRGEIFQRKPMFHKRIMQLIGEGKIVSIPNAGTSVYRMSAKEYRERNGDDKST